MRVFFHIVKGLTTDLETAYHTYYKGGTGYRKEEAKQGKKSAWPRKRRMRGDEERGPKQYLDIRTPSPRVVIYGVREVSAETLREYSLSKQLCEIFWQQKHKEQLKELLHLFPINVLFPSFLFLI